MLTIYMKLHRLRTKKIDQLFRTVMLRIWPLSIITRSYYRFRYWEPIWKYLNRNARAVYVGEKVEPTSAQCHALKVLRKDGICIMRIEELLEDKTVFTRIYQEAQKLLSQPDIQAQIRGEQDTQNGKRYVVRACPMVDTPNELISFVLNDKILDIVNSYLEMCCRLKFFELWYNIPVDSSSPEIASQKWHRDYDDRKLVKLFLYLNDVDETMGPFSYLKGTHPEGDYAHLFPSIPPQGSYPPDGAVDQMIPQSQKEICTGKAGTLILCDTSGLHKGGRSTTSSRVLYTALYASDAAIDPDRCKVNELYKIMSLSPAAKYASRYSG